jgi:shikimate dehydrogenase
METAMTIDGATRIYAIVGDPIAHARSPLVYNPRIEKAGRNAVLIPWHVPAASFDVAMRGLQQTANVDGIIVTFPFKQQALAVADAVAIRARQVGATNALRREADGRWTADMFDGVGLVRAVASAGRSVRQQRIWLIGAGGAGSAIAFALADAGAAALHVTDLNSARAKSVAEAIAATYPACSATTTAPHLDDISILINATTVGLTGEDELPVAAASLPGHLTVVDIVPRRDPTRLLALAQASGCTTIAGSAMVEGQADAVLEFLWHSSGKA